MNTLYKTPFVYLKSVPINVLQSGEQDKEEGHVGEGQEWPKTVSALLAAKTDFFFFLLSTNWSVYHQIYINKILCWNKYCNLFMPVWFFFLGTNTNLNLISIPNRYTLHSVLRMCILSGLLLRSRTGSTLCWIHGQIYCICNIID